MSTKLDYDNYLQHYGVKGMKWGVRKGGSKKSVSNERYEQIKESQNRSFQVTSKSGDILDVKVNKPLKFVNWIASKSNKATNKFINSPMLNLSHNGKEVGNAAIRHISKDELNLSWLGINPKYRGKGYASAAFDSAVEYGRQKGYKKITLEVPGNAPDARHIYEKRGFKVVKEPTKKEIDNDIMWGGLTHMALDLDAIRHSSNYDDSFDDALLNTFIQMSEEEWSFVFDDIEHTITHDDYLEHYGVKGMKWGVRKKEPRSFDPIPDSEKSARFLQNEAKYLRDGDSKEVAAQKAARRQKVEKALLIAGGATAAVTAAYIGKTMYDKRFKGVDLKMGTELKNIHALGDKQDFDRRLYVTNRRADTNKYRGLLAKTLENQGKEMNGRKSPIYESVLKTTEHIKAPSNKKAKSLYSEFRKTLDYEDYI